MLRDFPENLAAPLTGLTDLNLDTNRLSSLPLVKVAYHNPKRGLLQSEKRPITIVKETYNNPKRGLLEEQKRPITRVKETYYKSKRDLLQ